MPPRAFAGPLGVNQGEGIPPPRDLITSDTPPGTPRDDDDDDLTVASVCNIGMRGNKKAMAGAVQRFDESMTPEQGLLNLRRKIALQLKGGSPRFDAVLGVVQEQVRLHETRHHLRRVQTRTQIIRD